MKKLITGITIAAMITLMSTTIFAAELPASDSVQANKATRVERSAMRNEFKLKVAPLREERKVNRDENIAIREQNKALALQIKEKLATLKENESKLTEEQKASLKSLREEVKLLRSEIAATKGQIKAIGEANKENLKDMDFDAVEAAFNQIYEIQTLRHDKLQQINNTLDEILQTLN